MQDRREARDIARVARNGEREGGGEQVLDRVQAAERGLVVGRRARDPQRGAAVAALRQVERAAVDHREVVGAATLVARHARGHLGLAEVAAPVAQPLLGLRLVERHRRVGAGHGEPVVAEGLDQGGALLEVEFGDEVALAKVEVHGARVHAARCAVLLDVAEHAARLAVDDRHDLRARAAQRHTHGRIVEARPDQARRGHREVVGVELDHRLAVLDDVHAEDALVARTDGGLGRCAREVRDADLGVVRIEGDRLYGPVEQRLWVACEPLVERVVAEHQHAEPALAAAGTAPLLAQGGDRAGEAHDDRAVEVADVDAELKCVGGDHCAQVAARQALLDLAAHLRRVARAVGLHALGQRGLAPRQLLAHAAQDQLDELSAGREADDALVVAHQLRDEVDGLVDARGALAGGLVEQRGVPQRDVAAGARRAVVVDNRHVDAGERTERLVRIAHGGGGKKKLRRGAVERSAAAQPADHVRDMAAEHPAVDVRLVDDDRAEARQPLVPAVVVRADADVDHVGVAEHEVRLGAREATAARVAIAVDQRDAQVAAQAERVQAAGLVLRQRLGGGEIERAAVRLSQERLKHRHGVRERLAAGRARGDADVVALTREGDRLGLMRPERGDAVALERGQERRRQIRRQRRRDPGRGGLLATKDEAIIGRRTKVERRIPRRPRAHGASGCVAAGNEPSTTTSAERLATSASARSMRGSSRCPSMSIKNW